MIKFNKFAHFTNYQLSHLSFKSYDLSDDLKDSPFEGHFEVL
jgi:hypothetical protein